MFSSSGRPPRECQLTINLDHSVGVLQGYALFSLGATAHRFHVVNLARPGPVRLAAVTGDAVYMSLRGSDQALCVKRCTGSLPIRTLTLDVGDRRPPGIGAGSLALLAPQEPSEIDRVVRTDHAARRDYPDFTDTRLRRKIASARRDGYAHNDGRIVSAMATIGVPVCDSDVRVMAALSIAAIRERREPARVAKLEAAVTEGAARRGRLLDTRPQAERRRKTGLIREEQH